VCLFFFCCCFYSLFNLMISIGGEKCVVCNLNSHFYMLSLNCCTELKLQNYCTELLVMVLTCYFSIFNLMNFTAVLVCCGNCVKKCFAGLIVVWGRRKHDHNKCINHQTIRIVFIKLGEIVRASEGPPKVLI